jgi:hypothetical protein
LLEALKSKLVPAGVNDVASIITTLCELEAKALRLRRECEVLASLRYEHMDARQVAITEAHDATFKWIFTADRQPKNDPRSRVEFRQWLSGEDGIYWISGKPGSGKSTLMKYLTKCRDTEKCLEVWAERDRFAMPSYYFWISGAPMQKSQQGLLQQLLFELFQAFPDLLRTICPSDRWNRASRRDWSVGELLSTFEKLDDVQGGGDVPSTKICFFIDGLDEYHGDHRDLIKTVKTISRLRGVKLCVSSRPWNCFEDAFGGNPQRKLYLEDCTRDDIANYASSRLSESREHALGRSIHRALVHEITERAQGVFLWVYLVVRSLRDGFDNGDSLALLQDRLREFPSDLDEFFQRLIMSVDTVYRRRMSASFQVALVAPRPMLLIQYLFLGEDNKDLVAEIRSTTSSRAPEGGRSDWHETIERQIRQDETRVQRQLNGRYKGLLEARGFPETRTVDFIHRTVRDFLMSDDMQNLLNSHCERGFDPSFHACVTLLAQARRYPGSLDSSELDIFMSWARMLEVERGFIEPWVIEEMDRLFHVYSPSRPVRHDTVVGKAIEFGIVSYMDYLTSAGLSELAGGERAALTLALMPRLADISLPDDVFTTLDQMLSLLLRRGLDPNKNRQCSEAVVTFLSFYTDAHYIDLNHAWSVALNALLSHGIDIDIAFRGDGCWFTFVLDALDEVTLGRNTEFDWRDYVCMDLEAFFDHGLDPNGSTSHNSRFRAMTIWESLVEAVICSLVGHGLAELTCVRLVILFLTRGADVSFRLSIADDHKFGPRILQVMRSTRSVVDIGLAELLQFFTPGNLELEEVFRKAEAGYYRRPKRKRCRGNDQEYRKRRSKRRK